jgi:hypothetical protein
MLVNTPRNTLDEKNNTLLNTSADNNRAPALTTPFVRVSVSLVRVYLSLSPSLYVYTQYPQDTGTSWKQVAYKSCFSRCLQNT